MLNIAVVDDFSSDRKELIDLMIYFFEIKKVEFAYREFTSGEEFLDKFVAHEYDIIFLDIYLGGLDGIKVASELRKTDEECIVIFTTNSAGHALMGYRVRALDYLLKPLNPSHLDHVLTLCLKQTKQNARYIEVKEGRTMVKIPLSQIIYVDYYKHYVQIHTTSKLVRSYISFPQITQMLQPYEEFMSCFRNCIINMNMIATAEERDFITKYQDRVPIARAKREDILRKYSEFVFSKLE